jgi:hypothetical protein
VDPRGAGAMDVEQPALELAATVHLMSTVH